VSGSRHPHQGEAGSRTRRRPGRRGRGRAARERVVASRGSHLLQLRARLVQRLRLSRVVSMHSAGDFPLSARMVPVPAQPYAMCRARHRGTSASRSAVPQPHHDAPDPASRARRLSARVRSRLAPQRTTRSTPDRFDCPVSVLGCPERVAGQRSSSGLEGCATASPTVGSGVLTPGRRRARQSLFVDDPSGRVRNAATPLATRAATAALLHQCRGSSARPELRSWSA